MTENDAFILKKTKEFLQQIITDKPKVRNELQALGWLFSCYENQESPEMEKDEKGKLDVEIHVLQNILDNMEDDPIVKVLDDIKMNTTLRMIKTVIISLKQKNHQH